MLQRKQKVTPKSELEEELAKFRKDSLDSIEKDEKKNESLEINLKEEYSKLLKEINQLKIMLETQKTLNDKAIYTVENKCKKLVKEAFEEHDKSIKDAVQKTLSEFKADPKSNIHPGENLNDVNTNLNHKNSEISRRQN